MRREDKRGQEVCRTLGNNRRCVGCGAGKEEGGEGGKNAMYTEHKSKSMEGDTVKTNFTLTAFQDPTTFLCASQEARICI